MFNGSIEPYATISDTRLALVPDIPAFGEFGLPALSYSQLFGFFAPKETPRDIVGKLNTPAMEGLLTRSQLQILTYCALVAITAQWGRIMPAEQEYQMKKLLLVTALTIAASPAFADELFDACFKLATDRVGHVSQTAHGHFNKFVRECIRGSIPSPEIASAAAFASQRSKAVRVNERGHTVGVDEGGEGRIKCVTGLDGQKRCY